MMFSLVHKKTTRPSYEQPQHQQQAFMPIKMNYGYRQIPVQAAKPVANVDANPLPKT